jgi:non-heme chloroperoxidase
MDIPVLAAQGDDDQIVLIAASAPKTAELLSNATLRIHLRAPHGLHGAFEQQFQPEPVGLHQELSSRCHPCSSR